MAKPYIKLDWDWRDDSKVMLFEDRHGKAALVDLIQLFCLLAEFGGSLDLNDEATSLRAQKVLRKKPKALEAFIDRVAACGIVSEDGWRGFRRVGSERSVKDAKARQSRRDYALIASEAAAQARREGEGGNVDNTEGSNIVRDLIDVISAQVKTKK